MRKGENIRTPKVRIGGCKVEEGVQDQIDRKQKLPAYW
jgi:hypothetical protein